MLHCVVHVIRCRSRKVIQSRQVICWGWSFHVAVMRRNPSSWLLSTASRQSISSCCSSKVVFIDSCATCKNKPGIERVQALDDILHSVLCCLSNKTCAPIANLPNSAQLEGTAYHSPKLHPAPCSIVGMWRGTDTQTAVATIHFTSYTTHAKCDTSHVDSLQLDDIYCRWLQKTIG